MDLQFFAEEALGKQSIAQLRKGIRNLRERISEHRGYIDNPKSKWHEWDSFSEVRQRREIRHWEKEIKNFEESVQNRIIELEKRGERHEQ